MHISKRERWRRMAFLREQAEVQREEPDSSISCGQKATRANHRTQMAITPILISLQVEQCKIEQVVFLTSRVYIHHASHNNFFLISYRIPCWDLGQILEEKCIQIPRWSHLDVRSNQWPLGTICLDLHAGFLLSFLLPSHWALSLWINWYFHLVKSNEQHLSHKCLFHLICDKSHPDWLLKHFLALFLYLCCCHLGSQHCSWALDCIKSLLAASLSSSLDHSFPECKEKWVLNLWSFHMPTH